MTDKNTKICSQLGCTKLVNALGMCAAHYKRQRLYGDPLANKKRSGNMSWLRNIIKLNSQDCIEWPFFYSVHGYPLLSWRGLTLRAHRVACRLAHGKPQNINLHAAHSCGNKRCVNPKHIRWATALENISDKKIHGTMAIGSKVWSSILNEEDVKQIRECLRSGQTCAHIARQHGVSRSTISKIKNGNNWAWM